MISFIRVAIIMIFLYSNRTITIMEDDAKNWSLAVIGEIMMKEYGLWYCGLENKFKGLSAPS